MSLSKISGAALLSLTLTSPAVAGQLVLLWTDNSFDEQGFKIERCQVLPPATTCANYVQIAAVGAVPDTGGTKTFVNNNLLSGSTWCYRVRAYNATGHSGYSNEACGIVGAGLAPLDPVNLQVQ